MLKVTKMSCHFDVLCISLLYDILQVLVVDNASLPLVKLCDFGFSKDKFDDSAPQTQIGTALFTAPEVFLNVAGHVYEGEAVDVWSCGVVRGDCSRSSTSPL